MSCDLLLQADILLQVVFLFQSNTNNNFLRVQPHFLGKWSVCVVFVGEQGKKNRRDTKLIGQVRTRHQVIFRVASQKHELNEKIIKIISFV